MYGLPHAGKIANNCIRKHLQPYDYKPVIHTPGLWQHATRPIAFTLVVDDFGVKYTRLADITHLQAGLEKQYKITIDNTGSLYCGLTLDWQYNKRYVEISMPGYIDRILHQWAHPSPTKPQNSPHAWSCPIYGAAVQYAPLDPDLPVFPPAQIKQLQSIIGGLLYYD